jgi:hypothetical protein
MGIEVKNNHRREESQISGQLAAGRRKKSEGRRQQAFVL